MYTVDPAVLNTLVASFLSVMLMKKLEHNVGKMRVYCNVSEIRV